MMPKRPSPTAIHGNIFEALGLEGAPELQARVDLAAALTHEVRRVIQIEGLSQRSVAERIGLHPTDLSKLMNGVVGEFSQERLERALNQLGCDVEITVRRARDDHAPTTTVDCSELLETVA
jgi:predicted XRE-type DNA-binding protein